MSYEIGEKIEIGGEEMTLEVRVINLKIAMSSNKPKSVVRYKYRKYMEEYDNKDKDVIDKVRHRDISLDYLRYMSSSGDNKK